jgi:hypothetical protein
MPRALSQRASQKPSRPASKATAMRSILRPAFSASSRQRLSSFSNALSSTASFFNGWRSTPGTMPATSQLDKPISITAISALSCFRTITKLPLDRLLLKWFRRTGSFSSFTDDVQERVLPRRIYTDGREFPKEHEPGFMGYSIGRWLDTDGDGRFDTLEVETRNFKGPRTYEFSGIPLHKDNQSIIRERIHLDKADRNIMHNEITVYDHALTRPWTVNKRYSRQYEVVWYEDNCTENNLHVVVGKEDYFLSADGFLMPTRKDQAAPDLRYFNQTKK